MSEKAHAATPQSDSAKAAATKPQSEQSFGQVLQTTLGNAHLAQMHEAFTDGGEPLDASLRKGMESAFGSDFGDVRVHRGTSANDAARDLHANAFTAGNHIFFGAASYAPGTAAGYKLLAHELTHTLQAPSGVAASPALPIGTPGDETEREADAVAGRVAAGDGVNGQAITKSAPAIHGDFLDDVTDTLSGALLGSAAETVVAEAGDLGLTLVDAAMGSLLGDTIWSFLKEMMRGFNEGISAQLEAGAGEQLKDRFVTLMTSVSDMTDFSLGYLKGLGLGLISPITDIWNLIKTVYQVNKSINEWIANAAIALFRDPGLIRKKLDDLSKRFDELMDEAAAQLVSFLSDPSGAGDTLSKLVDSLTAKALAKARELGHSAADSVFEFLNLPYGQLGEKIGYVVGALIIQILLLVFSEAIGNAIEAAMQAAAKLGDLIAEGAMAVFRFVAGLGEKIMALFEDAGELFGNLFEGLLSKFKAFFQSFTDFFESLSAAIRAPATAGGPEAPGFFATAAEPKGPIIPRDPAAVAALKPQPLAMQATSDIDVSSDVADIFEESQTKWGPVEPEPGEGGLAPGEDVGEPGRMTQLQPLEEPNWTDEMQLGRDFDEMQAPNYEFNQVRLRNGKVLDSYNPGEEIVSRKRTQLARLSEFWQDNYMNELFDKYGPGNIIANTGQPLSGRFILEIPPQMEDVPMDLLERAERLGVTIRDVDGRIYSPLYPGGF